MVRDIFHCWVPNHERHHVFEKPEPLVAHCFLGQAQRIVFHRSLGQPSREGVGASFRFQDFIGLVLGLVIGRQSGLLGLLDRGVQLVDGTEGEVRVSEVEVETFIGDNERVRVVADRSTCFLALHLGFVHL